MELLVAILTVALALSLGWGAWLWRRRRAAEPPPSPPPELFSPLFNAAAAAYDAGLVLVDDDRRVRFLNQQAEELLNLSRTVGIGQGLITLVRDYQVDAMVGEVLRDREPREIVIQPLGRQRTLRVRAVPLDGGAHGALLLARDVTQLSMLERARRDMVANVSHELRTPLASVKLLVETLQSGPPAPVATRMLSQMAQEVDAITQLVDELHELSQIESGRVALQLVPTGLLPVTARAIERIRPQVERKGLQVRTAVPPDLPLLLMDDDRVGQILLNLLHNAVKFTPEGGEICIDARLLSIDPQQSELPPALREAHAGSEWVVVSVSDTGIGIPPADLPRIFERFYKVDRARTRNAGGTGLGLAIAKHLVEGHGGRIWATSQEMRGSVFCFTLPVA